MPPTARMTPDEKRIARGMRKRGFIPKHIADQLGREAIIADADGEFEVTICVGTCDA